MVLKVIDLKEGRFEKVISCTIFIILMLTGSFHFFLQEEPQLDGLKTEIIDDNSLNNEKTLPQGSYDPNAFDGSSPTQKGTRASWDDLDLQGILGYGSTVGFLNSIKSADVDNDGKEEIVFGNEEGNIFVTERDGDGIRNEWISPFLGGGKTFGLDLGDVDSDSIIEIITGSADGVVRIFGWNGIEYVLEWESSILGHFSWGLSVGNLDNDEYPEIVVGTGELEYGFNSNGEWSYRVVQSPVAENLFIFGFDGVDYGEEWSTIVPALDQYNGIYNVIIGDTDGDSTNEIVIGTFDIRIDTGERLGRYGIFGFNGVSYSTEWPLTELGGLVMSLVLGDTDNEDDLDIVIAVYGAGASFAVHVYGYEAPFYTQEWITTELQSTSLTVGDTDDDGTFEIIASQGRWVKIYEFSGVTYQQTWESGDLGTFVSGIGVGQTDSDSQNEFIVADYYSILIYGKEASDYKLMVFEKGMDRIVSSASWDMDDNGLPELYLLSITGLVSILEYDSYEFHIKGTFEVRSGVIDPNIKYTNILIDNFDSDIEKEILVVEGNTSIGWMLGGLTRSMLSSSTLFFVEYTGFEYSVIDQVHISDSSLFSVDVDDLDDDTLIEVAASGSNGELYIIGNVGSSYEIEDRIYVSDSTINCVGTGNTDDDGTIEIALGGDSNMVHIIGYNGIQYEEEWNTTLTQMEFPLALDIVSMDGDNYEEIFIKGGTLSDFSQVLPLSIYGWDGIDYVEEERLNDYHIVFDEGLIAGDVLSDSEFQLLIGSFNLSIIEHDIGYSEVWLSVGSGTNILSTQIANIDDYAGNELIVARDGMISIYGAYRPPEANLSVNLDSVIISEEILYDGSSSKGKAPLKYFFDFGDGENTGWIFNSTVTHNYSLAGEFIASLKVRDKNDIENINTALVTIVVLDPNIIPQAFIDEITPNPAVIGETVTFTGHGNDDDGSITSYWWESSINGHINSSESFSTSSLAIGIHTIYFRVRDDRGAWSDNDWKTFEIEPEPQNQIPVAYIDSISPNPALEGETIMFSGHGVDGDGTIISFLWESDIDGVLGEESSIDTSSLSVGTHNISFKVKDNDGAWSLPVPASLTIDPIPPNLPPVAYIDSVSPNPSFKGEIIIFLGHGSDEDGSIISYSWESDIDGILSNERSFSSSSLSVGEHTITLLVKDDEETWSDSAIVTLIVKKKSSDEGSSGGFDFTSNVFMFLLLSIIFTLIIIVVIASVIAKRKKKSSITPMQISCPDCRFIFGVSSEIRPLTVQCPNCGQKGVMR